MKDTESHRVCAEFHRGKLWKRPGIRVSSSWRIGLTMFLLLSLNTSDSTAQTKWEKLRNRWSAQVHGGFVIPHHPEIRSLVTGHARGLGFSYERRCSGQRDWHKAYIEPALMVEGLAMDLGNPEQLGQQYSIVTGIILSLSHQSMVDHRLKMGIGPGYSTKIWDLNTNHESTVVGSRFSSALVLEYSAVVPVLRRGWHLNLGARMTHFSNGAFKMPNLGTNVPSIFIGIWHGETLKFRPTGWDPQSRYGGVTPRDSSSRHSFSIFGGTGLREILPPGGPKYQIFTFTGGYDYRVSYKSAFGIFADVVYNQALTPLIEEVGETVESRADNLRLGLAAGYTLHFDDWHLKFMTGAYLKNEYKKSGWMYNRVTLRKHFASGWFASIGLKTHKTVADHGEWGFGYNFGK